MIQDKNGTMIDASAGSRLVFVRVETRDAKPVQVNIALEAAAARVLAQDLLRAAEVVEA